PCTLSLHDALPIAADVHGDLAGEVAVGNSCRDFRDVAHLSGQVAGHEVDVVRQILPGAGNTGDLRLDAEFAVGSHLPRHARDFARESIKLIHHRIEIGRPSGRVTADIPVDVG